jgi:hypothetical protein
MDPHRVLWELQVDYELFSLQLMDMTGDGNDELIACSWDGMTYIVDQLQNVVKFKFEESVCAFTAGKCFFIVWVLKL